MPALVAIAEDSTRWHAHEAINRTPTEYETQNIQGAQVAAVLALGQLGPGARAALPLLARLANGDGPLSRAAVQAMPQVRGMSRTR